MVNRIFLNDTSIVECGRTKDNFGLYNAQTVLIDEVGFTELNTIVGPYTIIGNANRYLADIIPWDNETILKTTRKPQRKILFEGIIQIYQNDSETPKKTTTSEQILSEFIRYATSNNPIFRTHEALELLVLRESKSPQKQLERVEAIINGYRYQEDTFKENARTEALKLFCSGENPSNRQFPLPF